MKAFMLWLVGVIGGLVVCRALMFALITVVDVGPAVAIGLLLSVGIGAWAGRALAVAKRNDNPGPGARWALWGLVAGGLGLFPGLLVAWIVSGITQRSVAARSERPLVERTSVVGK
jgi:hypothetical protein